MKEKIGVIAGRIWESLHSEGEKNITQIPKILDEKSSDVYQALGWLAREDKINFRSENNKTFVSLKSA
jgi:hypothetical protein